MPYFMKCKYCNADVSPAATICPKCHHSVMETNPAITAQRKKKRWLIIGVAAIAAVFVFTTIGLTLRSQQNMSEQVKTASAGQAVPDADGTLDITYALLAERFNNNANVKKAKMSLPDAKKGEASFSANLSKTILLNGKIDEQGRLQSLNMMARPDNKDELLKMVTVIGVLAESLFPSDADNVRTHVLDDLGFKKGSSLKEADNMSLQGHIRFRFKAVPDSGYLLAITDKDAE